MNVKAFYLQTVNLHRNRKQYLSTAIKSEDQVSSCGVIRLATTALRTMKPGKCGMFVLFDLSAAKLPARTDRDPNTTLQACEKWTLIKIPARAAKFPDRVQGIPCSAAAGN